MHENDVTTPIDEISGNRFRSFDWSNIREALKQKEKKFASAIAIIA